MDASTASTLKTALENSGFSVNETLLGLLRGGRRSQVYGRPGRSGNDHQRIRIGGPLDAYTDDVTDSVASYGDAAIVVLSRVGGEGADLQYDGTNYLALDQNEKDMLDNLASMKEQGIVKKIVLLINSANPLQVDF